MAVLQDPANANDTLLTQINIFPSVGLTYYIADAAVIQVRFLIQI